MHKRNEAIISKAIEINANGGNWTRYIKEEVRKQELEKKFIKIIKLITLKKNNKLLSIATGDILKKYEARN